MIINFLDPLLFHAFWGHTFVCPWLTRLIMTCDRPGWLYTLWVFSATLYSIYSIYCLQQVLFILAWKTWYIHVQGKKENTLLLLCWFSSFICKTIYWLSLLQYNCLNISSKLHFNWFMVYVSLCKLWYNIHTYWFYFQILLKVVNLKFSGYL